MKRLIILAFLATSAEAQDAEIGAEIYTHRCATCHGVEMTGNGPMAPVLLLQPTDLTRLSETNEGVFPTLRVAMRIDGRDPLVSHGSPMPVYGEFFQGIQDVPLKAASGQPMLTSQPVADLIAYLESVQE